MFLHNQAAMQQLSLFLSAGIFSRHLYKLEKSDEFVALWKHYQCWAFSQFKLLSILIISKSLPPPPPSCICFCHATSVAWPCHAKSVAWRTKGTSQLGGFVSRRLFCSHCYLVYCFSFVLQMGGQAHLDQYCPTPEQPSILTPASKMRVMWQVFSHAIHLMDWWM